VPWSSTGKGVDSINGNDRVESVSVGGETIKADMVLLAAGVKPNVGLAKNAGIDIGPAGGIDVDEHFHVKKNGKVLEDVYAAGDCIEEVNAISGRKVVCAIGTVANRQAGYLASELMGMGVPYGPVLCPAITVVGDVQIGSVGLIPGLARRSGSSPYLLRQKAIRGPVTTRMAGSSTSSSSRTARASSVPSLSGKRASTGASTCSRWPYTRR